MATDAPSLRAIVATVADACRVARQVQRTFTRAHAVTKEDLSPVTVADFAVQAVVALDLVERDPEALIVAEERADLLHERGQSGLRDAVIDAVRGVRPSIPVDETLRAIDRGDHDGTGAAFWALDPVDGTKGFLRGQQYAIALARIEAGRVTAAVMGCPNLTVRPDGAGEEAGVLYTATAGGGTRAVPLDDLETAIDVRAATWSGDRPLRVCESVEAAHSRQSDVSRILDALGHGTDTLRLDSQCKYAVVARGQADAYLRLPTRPGYVEKIWDHAAGCLIATEAGAVVSDISGEPLQFTHGRRLEANRGIVCATAGVHEAVIATIDRLGLATQPLEP